MGTIIFGKNVELDYITDGAEMECTFGSMPCNLKTLPKKIVIGGKAGCTIKDNDPIANEFNFGVCSLTQKPCSSLIKLLEWQNAKEDLKIEGASALTEESTIFCTQGGKITFKHSGQFQENKVTTGAEKAKSEYGKASEEKAKLQVTKVAFETSYDICSDDYGLLYEKKNKEGEMIDAKSQGESDYIKTYILEDEGEYYHWLNKRSNPLDDKKYKPDVLPITFASEEPIGLKAILRVVSDKKCDSTPQVRVTHKTRDKKEYKFKTFSVKPLDDEQYEVVVVSTNLPFEGTIKYLEIFELLFEYSEDGKMWVSAGTSRNTLYITWKCPLYEKFYNTENDILSSNIQIISRITKKRNILETLLWLGCANGEGKDEETIVKNIFLPFEGRLVTRAREGTSYLNFNWCDKGLGYWRGISDNDNPSKDNKKSKMFYDRNNDKYIRRGLRTLLAYGEARCGEWTDFFLHILLAQGIFVNEEDNTFAIVTDIKNNTKLKDYHIPRFRNFSIVFTVKEAIFSLEDKNIKKYIRKGKSIAKGNDDAQPYFSDHIFVYFRKKFFLDPSYGILLDEKESTLENYCNKYITSIFLYDNNCDTYIILFERINGFVIYDALYNYIVGY